jgi:DNA primase
VNSPIDGKSLVLSATDIVQLIGQSVKLTRRGKDYIGLCPFHSEKTPSFNVIPSKQIFHCFGCKASGNAIDFVIKRDRVEFRDALETLAKAAGIDLPKTGGQKKSAGERQQLLDACSAAAGLFDKWLQHPQIGKSARGYLDERGFNSDSVRRFSIGFAPESWDGLLTSLSKKFSVGLLQQAGLVKARDTGSGHYDVFRNRLMFPIRDETGRTIAFGGRIMPGADADKTAKYLNSPETPLFHKGRAVFGLDLAKQKIIETRTVAIVEGYTDVVMAHQYGASNVCSILGTAMTENHVALLRRFAEKIVLLFDADAAGDAAVNRTVELFLTQPVEIAIATIPDGLDPDEFLLKHGADGFNDLLGSAVDALTYKWEQLRRQFESAGDLTGEQKAVSAYLDLLSNARQAGPVDQIRWGAALNRVSKLTGMPVDELHRRFGASRNAGKSRFRRVGGNVTDVAQAPADESPKLHRRREQSADERAESHILGCVLSDPSRWDDLQQDVQPQDFTSEAHRALAEVFWDVARHDGHVELHELLGYLQDERMKELAVSLVQEIEALSDLEQAIAGAVEHVHENRRRLAQSATMAQLARLADAKASPPSLERDQDEVALLRQLSEHANRPDMRRGLR